MKLLIFTIIITVSVASIPSNYTIYKLGVSPVIDTSFEEWDTNYIIDSIGYGGNDGNFRYHYLPFNPGNLKAILYSGWNDSAIYIAVKINNNINNATVHFFVAGTNQSYSILCQGDSNMFYNSHNYSFSVNATSKPKVFFKCCLRQDWLKQAFGNDTASFKMGVMVFNMDASDDSYTETIFGGGKDTTCDPNWSVPCYYSDKDYPTWHKSNIVPPLYSENIIKFNSLTSHISILPNPCSGNFTVITNEHSKSPNALTLHDISGRVVKSLFMSSGRLILKTNELPTGIYFLKAENNFRRYCQKLIILQ